MSLPIKLTRKMRDVARLSACGWIPRKIATRVGLTQDRVCAILDMDIIVSLLDTFREMEPAEQAEWHEELTAGQILQRSAPVAAEKLIDVLIMSDRHQDTIKAAEAILDRTGHAKQTEIKHTTVLIDAEMARLIAESEGMTQIEEADFTILEEDNDNEQHQDDDGIAEEPGDRRGEAADRHGEAVARHGERGGVGVGAEGS